MISPPKLRDFSLPAHGHYKLATGCDGPILHRRQLNIALALQPGGRRLLQPRSFGDLGLRHFSRLAHHSQTVIILRLGEGRAILYFQKGTTTAKIGAPVAFHTSFNRRSPDLRRSLWEFDAHRLPIAGLSTSWIFACPIKCLILPCLVAPIVWWRTTRRPAEARGFELNPMNVGPIP